MAILRCKSRHNYIDGGNKKAFGSGVEIFGRGKRATFNIIVAWV
jgi:hypothetical protein